MTRNIKLSIIVIGGVCFISFGVWFFFIKVHQQNLVTGAPNCDTSFSLFQQQAQQGDPQAQFNVAICYRDGEGVSQDVAKSFQWLQKSAEQNNSEAQFVLGNMYYFGKGTKKDLKQSFQWFDKAAHAGNPWAQYAIGYMCEHGEGTKINLKEAKEWYQKAARHHILLADVALKRVFAKDGDPKAQYTYAKHLIVHEKNAKEAFKWYEKAAMQNYVPAQKALADLYLQGLGVSQNKVKAYQWLIIAVNNGMPEAFSEREELAKQLSSKDKEKAQRDAKDWIDT